MDFENNQAIFFTETDKGVFPFAEHVYNALRPNLRQVYSKAVSIESLKSDRQNNTIFGDLTAFCRTAHASFRKCFLMSSNIHETYWPGMSANIKNQNVSINHEHLADPAAERFVLADNEFNALLCYTYYDQLNPLSVIKYKVDTQHLQEWTSRMIIVHDFHDLVFVTTFVRVNLGQQKYEADCGVKVDVHVNLGQQKYEADCGVKVECVHYHITPDTPDKVLSPLQMLVNPTHYNVTDCRREREEGRDDEEKNPDQDVEDLAAKLKGLGRQNKS